MTERLRWERIEPEQPCTSPDGHEAVDVTTLRSSLPEQVLCPLCGAPWTIKVLGAVAVVQVQPGHARLGDKDTTP